LPICARIDGKIAHDKIVAGKRHAAKRRGVPGDTFLYTAREALDEIRFPACHVKIVKHLGAVVPLFARAKYRSAIVRQLKPPLPRPNALHVGIGAVGEKRPLRSPIDSSRMWEADSRNANTASIWLAKVERPRVSSRIFGRNEG